MPRGELRRRWWAAAALAAFLVALAAATAHREPRFGRVGQALLDAVSVVAAPFRRVAEGARALAEGVAELRHLREENRRLREELARQRALDPALLQAIASYGRLRALLGLKERYGEVAVAAQVVLRTPDRWLEQVVIDAGRADGVEPGMPVVTVEGLVGRVVAVTPHHATVMLVTDPESGVGAMVVQTRDAGVVLGSHVRRGRLVLHLYSPEAAPQPGHLVVTSGYGGTFPPGIPVGTVEAVERGRLTPLATVRPAVDLHRLGEVLVLRVREGAAGSLPSPWLVPAPAGREPTEPPQGDREVR